MKTNPMTTTTRRTMIMTLILMTLALAGAGFARLSAKKYPNYGEGVVRKELDHGFIVWSAKLKRSVYVEKHRLWRSDGIKRNFTMCIYVVADGKEVVGGIMLEKFLYRGDKSRAGVNDEGDVRVF